MALQTISNSPIKQTKKFTFFLLSHLPPANEYKIVSHPIPPLVRTLSVALRTTALTIVALRFLTILYCISNSTSLHRMWIRLPMTLDFWCTEIRLLTFYCNVKPPKTIAVTVASSIKASTSMRSGPDIIWDHWKKSTWITQKDFFCNNFL